jgi:uncharacterized protein DUF4430
MNRLVAAIAVTVLSGSVAAGGCGIGPGDASEGEANLTITRDYGSEQIGDGTLTGPTPSDTVVRFLDESADIDTSYGGNFVDSIDGLEGSTVNGGPEDWFFFVNGIYSDIGAGEAKVHPGDRLWWDYRRWAEAYRVPAVVGSWPEPFLDGYQGKHYDTVVECLASDSECGGVMDALRSAGVDPTLETVAEPVEHSDELRVLVGTWDRLRDDPAAAQIERGPGTSGVYAQITPCGSGGGSALSILGSDGEPRQQLSDAGLVAAVREDEDQPTWVVTATTDDALPDAVGLLGVEDLRNRYAVATDAGKPLPIPAADDLPPAPDAAC